MAGENVPVRVEQGGSKQVIASGGELEIQSGGELEVLSGATLDIQAGALVNFASGTQVQIAAVDLTNAEIKALNAAPKELVAAPGAGKLIEVQSAILLLDYGSNALAEPSAPDDLAIEYDDGSGTQIATWDTTGFITATADAMEIVHCGSVGGGASAVAAATNVNKNVVLQNTGGEYTGNAGNDTTMRVIVRYVVHTALGL